MLDSSSDCAEGFAAGCFDPICADRVCSASGSGVVETAGIAGIAYGAQIASAGNCRGVPFGDTLRCIY